VEPAVGPRVWVAIAFGEKAMFHSNWIVRAGSLFAIGLAAAGCGSAEEGGESADDASAVVTSALQACSWAGTWNGTWSSPIGDFKSPLMVTEQGGAVSASDRVDAGNVGIIRGKVTGSAFSGTWRRTIGTSGGPCEYGEVTGTISVDCKSFSGTWYWCNGSSRVRGGGLKGTR
jgi:hypothetical protein